MADRETPEYNRNPRFIKLKNNCECNGDCKCKNDEKKREGKKKKEKKKREFFLFVVWALD